MKAQEIMKRAGVLRPDGTPKRAVIRVKGGVVVRNGADEGYVVGLESFHDVPVRLLHASLRWESLKVVEGLEQNPGGASVSGPTHRRPHAHRQGDQLSVSRDERVRLQGGWHVR
nr:hypothetical protein JVH1_3387 [Rhodococcus sp. JVH1]